MVKMARKLQDDEVLQLLLGGLATLLREKGGKINYSQEAMDGARFNLRTKILDDGMVEVSIEEILN